MKNRKKLELKKITLTNLNDPALEAVAGAGAYTVKPACATVQTGCFGQKTCLVVCTGNSCFGC